MRLSKHTFALPFASLAAVIFVIVLAMSASPVSMAAGSSEQASPQFSHTFEYRGQSGEFPMFLDDDGHSPGEIVPGDKISGRIAILNSTSNDAEFFVRIEEHSGVSPAPADDIWENNATISVKRSDGGSEETLYSGTLAEVKASAARSIGDVPSSGNTSLSYEICVPDELLNEFSNTQTELDIVVTARPRVSLPLSGQSGFAFALAVGASLSIAAIALLADREKRKNDSKEER